MSGKEGNGKDGEKKEEVEEEDAPIFVPSILDRAGTGSTPVMERYHHTKQVIDNISSL